MKEISIGNATISPLRAVIDPAAVTELLLFFETGPGPPPHAVTPTMHESDGGILHGGKVIVKVSSQKLRQSSSHLTVTTATSPPPIPGV
jgi:hypothetical protein